MIYMLRLLSALLLAFFFMVRSVFAAPDTFSTEELIQGFQSTVFGLEYRVWSWRPYRVKKYTVPVRFYIHNLAQQNRTSAVRSFVHVIGKKIHGLTTSLASSADTANFQIYVVDRAQYADVVRKSVYEDPKAKVRGYCLVRVITGKRGIKRSTAVIVSDEGEKKFRRCLVEEILQGLGPMNDDDRLIHSVFNDVSVHSRFTVFDQILLNMLYDDRIKPGMSTNEIKEILPLVVRDARRRVH